MKIDYANGDRLKVEFRQVESEDDLAARYGTEVPKRELPNFFPAELLDQVPPPLKISFPVTAVEITMKVPGTPIDLSARQTQVLGSTITGSWIFGGAVGLMVGRA